MDLKERILDLLEKRNLTIKQLAEKIGMSETGFHSTLKNNTFKFETIVKICQILGVHVSYFTDKFAGEPINFNNPINDIDDDMYDLPNPIDSLSYENFLKQMTISYELNIKSGGLKMTRAIANIHEIYHFLDDYYKKYYHKYGKVMNMHIEKSLKENKSKTAIMKELLPFLNKRHKDPMINPKPIFKLEKAMITFFKEVSINVPKEDEDLQESIHEVQEMLNLK